MRTLHFDCFSGISGDMTVAALVSAGVPRERIETAVASLGLPIQLAFEPTLRGAFAALSLRVTAHEEQPHRRLSDVLNILERGQLTPAQRDLAVRIFRLIAAAEAKVHGISVDDVHFHEVGALDSLADIVAAAVGVELLGVEKFTSRSVPLGSGAVKAAHGVMPVPAPATAEILRGVPLAAAAVKSELTTPTGAAILKALVSEWTETPRLAIQSIGYGAGQKDFPQQANILRIFYGETAVEVPEGDRIWELQTNLDDLAPEIVGYCLERCLAAGAVDAYTQAIGMKKNRPGLLLTALVPDSARLAVEETIFAETGTFGIRRREAERSKLRREPRMVQTKWGPVQAKLGWREGHAPLLTPEYEDAARLARELGIPLRSVYEEVARAWAGSLAQANA